LVELNSILRETGDKNKFLITNILDVVVEVDIDGTFSYISSRVYDIFGYKPEEVIGTKFFSYIHLDDLDKVMQTREKALKGENIISVEFRVRHKVGHYITVSSKGSLVKVNDKTKIIGVLRDITEKIKTEKEFKEINRLKTEFLERTSHELKTPLISIKGFTDLLLDLHGDKFDDDVFSILGEIKHGTEQLEAIINKLLETSLLESGKSEFNPKEEDLSFLIRFCIQNLHGLAKTRNHLITLDIPNTMVLKFEKEKIYDVFSHLIINAIKYSPPYGSIKITANKGDNFACICVQDNGIGLSEDEQKRIFKRFGKIERYGQGWDIGIEGTGMGLYTSKKIVEMHGGKIWVESDGRDKGAKFCFTLPINLD
jgi:PAS domain S-box-containing protein